MPKFTQILSLEAQNDLVVIAEFTLNNWGERQFTKYRGTIERAFAEIARSPFSIRSKARDEIFPGCRSFHVGRHFIVYRVNGQYIQIFRILHDSMELERHMGQEFPDT